MVWQEGQGVGFRKGGMGSRKDMNEGWEGAREGIRVAEIKGRREGGRFGRAGGRKVGRRVGGWAGGWAGRREVGQEGGRLGQEGGR